MRLAAPVAAIVALVALALTPGALSDQSGGPDAQVSLSPAGEPTIQGHPGLISFVNATPGERYEFRVTIDRYSTFAFHLTGFDVERPRQMVPSLVVPEDRFPLFTEFAHERLWEADGAPALAYVNGTARDFVLSLSLAGPQNVTLVIERDLVAPTYTLGEPTDKTHFSFLRKSGTDELAIGDLQVRRAGTTEWVENPTPDYHFLQIFPIQGLAPDADHEMRFVFTDWAGNVRISPIETLRTLPRPVVPLPIVTAISPAPNSTVNATGVVIRASIDTSEAPLMSNGLSLFLDKRPIGSDLAYIDGELRYQIPGKLAPGIHSVAVEATNDEGGRGDARWTFTVAGETQEAPGVGLALALAGLAGVALALGRRR